MAFWMWKNKLSLVYPNLPGFLQFSTNHVGQTGTNQEESMRAYLEFPLLYRSRHERLWQEISDSHFSVENMSALTELDYYNARHQLESSYGKLVTRGWVDHLHQEVGATAALVLSVVLAVVQYLAAPMLSHLRCQKRRVGTCGMCYRRKLRTY
jgi:hypothetical protein